MTLGLSIPERNLARVPLSVSTRHCKPGSLTLGPNGAILGMRLTSVFLKFATRACVLTYGF